MAVASDGARGTNGTKHRGAARGLDDPPGGPIGHVRFGTYLRTLRVQRRLTLEQIEELSARYGTPVSKTYLSRCEHGQTCPTLPRLEVLSRIYRVRLGQVTERFELEREIARKSRSGEPDSLSASAAGSGIEDAAERAIDAARRDDARGALVLFDATRSRAAAARRDPRAHVDEARSKLCLAVLSGSIGNFRVCKDEAEALFCAEEIPEPIRLRACVQFALACQRLGRAPLARLLVADLLSRADHLPSRILADAHYLMGSIDLAAGAARPAVLHTRKAVAVYRDEGAGPELCRALMLLGEAYRRGGRLPEALTRYQEALVVARRADIKSLTADLLSHVGRAHFAMGKHVQALRSLFDSNEIARRGDYFDILFRNYYYLREIARARGDEFSRRTAERSLRVLAGRCDPGSEEARLLDRERSGPEDAPDAAPQWHAPDKNRRSALERSDTSVGHD